MINAKLYRNLIRAGIVAAALGHVALSHAGYAQVSPPPGYSPGNGLASGAGGTYTYPSAANAAGYSGGTVRTNAALNVGGRAVSIPVSMRVAANAGRAAAMAIYLHPALRTAAAVATWLGVAKITYDVADGLWKRVDPDAQTSDGKEYQAGTGPWSPTRESACSAYVAGIKPWGMFWSFKMLNVSGTTCNYMMYDKDGAPASTASAGISSRPSSCPAGWYVTSAGCVQTPPMQTVPQSDFVQGLPDARPMPPELPGIVWPAAWPIEIPEIQPTFIPTGNPVPNPNYDPSNAPGPNNQPYNQPGINVQPAPTPSSPWQVDVQPVNRPTSNPNPGSDPVPNVNPDGTPKPDPGDQQRDPKDEDKQDLCEKHPDILACQKVDTEVPDDKIPKAQKSITFAPEDSFGGGSCPADQYATVGGQQLKVVDWSRDCQYIVSNVRPLAFAITALIVAGILVGALKP